jgi:transposase
MELRGLVSRGDREWLPGGLVLARYVIAAAAITVEVVARTSPHSFQVLRRRWVVERTFG